MSISRWLSSGMLRRIVWHVLTDVSVVLNVSIIMAMSHESISTRLHGAISLKTAILILVTVVISHLSIFVRHFKNTFRTYYMETLILSAVSKSACFIPEYNQTDFDRIWFLRLCYTEWLKSHATHIKIYIDSCNSIQFDCINVTNLYLGFYEISICNETEHCRNSPQYGF
jgi:hypothetical protein